MSVFFKFTAILMTLLQVQYFCSAYNSLPKKFPHCSRNDSQVSECLLKATETVRPYIKKGIPELKMPKFEPFYIDRIVMKQGTQALYFNALLRNIIITGMSNYKFTKFDFDVPNLQFFIEFVVGRLNLTGDYSINGGILIAPINSNGKFDASVSSTNVTVYQKVKLTQINGREFIRPVVTNISINVGDPTAKLHGLYDTTADKIINQIIERNVDELFQNVRPVIEKTVTDITETVLIQSIEDVPYDELYPIS